MAEGKKLRTSGGVVLTDEVLDALADEAERGYELETLRPRANRSTQEDEESS